MYLIMKNIILKGCSIILLPEIVVYFYNSFLGKIIRILGSLCVILYISGFYLGVIFELLSCSYLFLLVILSLFKIIYGFYIIYNIYSINIYFMDFILYIIVLIRIFIVFVLDVLGFKTVEGLLEIFFYLYDIRNDLYTFYKRIIKMFV